jgi:hypothetical protein
VAGGGAGRDVGAGCGDTPAGDVRETGWPPGGRARPPAGRRGWVDGVAAGCGEAVAMAAGRAADAEPAARFGGPPPIAAVMAHAAAAAAAAAAKKMATPVRKRVSSRRL